MVRKTDDLPSYREEIDGLRSRIGELEDEVCRYQDIFNSAVLVIGNEFIRPLTSIKGYLGLLEGPCLFSGEGSVKIRRYLGKIEDSVKDLEELVDTYVQMLRFGKGSAMVGDNARIVLADFIDELRGKYCKDPSKVVNEVSRDLPELSVRKRHLEVVLGNILSNAEKFGGDAEPAVITAEITGRSQENERADLNVEVSDYGAGMSEEIKKKVFLPFFRGGGSPAGTGLGLGLAIAANVVSLMEGKIDIYSREGMGTTVALFLPVETNGSHERGGERE